MGKKQTRGMIIDGVIASEAIDSSGEVLDVKGCDISSLPVDGVLNYEHADPKRAGASFMDIIGRCIEAKKIYSQDDCSNERELMYWKQVKLPFIYGKFELFDAEGHPGAVAAAAMIRHYHNRGLPLLIRYSIEGSTLEKEGNRLKRCIGRAVAATCRPCNKTAFSGLLDDPNGNADTEEPKDPLEELTLKFENPDRRRLSNVSMEYNPLVEDPSELEKREEDINEMQKALSAGGAMGAPGTRTQMAALAKEWKNKPTLKSQMLAAIRDFDGTTKSEFRAFLKNRLPECDDEYIDYFTDLVDDFKVRKGIRLYNNLNKREGGEEKPKKKTAKKASGPKATKIRSNTYEGKKLKGGWQVENEGRGDRFVRKPQHRPARGPDKNPFGEAFAEPPTAPDYTPEMAAALPRVAYGDPNTPITTYYSDISESPETAYQRARADAGRGVGGGGPEVVIKPITLGGRPIPMNEGMTPQDVHFSDGALHMPEGSLPMYIPKGKELDAFMKVLRSDEIQRPWTEAMQNWLHMHNLAKNGQLPHEVVAHAALFSLLSPNTPVPMQEMMYSYLMDTMNRLGKVAWKQGEGGFDGSELDEWKRHDQPQGLPVHARDQFVPGGNLSSQVRVSGKGGQDVWDPKTNVLKPARLEGDMARFQMPENKFKGLMTYANLHPHLVGTILHHTAQAQARGEIPKGVDINEDLMRFKAQYELWKKRKGNTPDRWTTDDGTPLPTVENFKQKTMRYVLGMLGFGDIMVPDTHFVRHSFGLHGGTDKNSIETVKRYLWDENNSAALRAMDKHYMENHPAYQYVATEARHMFPGVPDEHLVFPAFWVHWISVPGHERAMGRGKVSSNDQTDHAAFWDGVNETLLRYKLPPLPSARYRKSEEMFEDLKKSVAADTQKEPLVLRTARAHHALCEQYGPTAAKFIYLRYIAPMLIAHGELRKAEEDRIARLQNLTIELRKSVAEEMLPELPPPTPPNGARLFRGKYVIPGEVEFISGAFNGKRVPMFHRDATHTFISPPHAPYQPELQKIRNDHAGKVYRVIREPQTVRVPTLVDANMHAVPGFSDDLNYKLLMHGLDLDADGEAAPSHAKPGQTAGIAWRKTPNGRMVFVKPSLIDAHDIAPMSDAYSTARREALYHHLAKTVFGLGHHVPATTAFIHPVTKVEHSVQELVPDGRHVENSSMGGHKSNSAVHDSLMRLGDAGVLHQLALMDHIMGNTDRSATNYLVTPEREPGLYLIDNGLAFSHVGSQLIPDYVRRYHRAKSETPEHAPLHPAAIQWARNLDTEKLAMALVDHGLPPHLVKQTMKKAMLTKKLAHEMSAPTLGDLIRKE